MQTEGAVRAPGRAGNLLGWLLGEVTSLVSTGAASIHISQEQGKKKTTSTEERERLQSATLMNWLQTQNSYVSGF